MRPVTVFFLGPVTGMTAIEFAPLLTAYSVPPSGDSVTADVAAPVYFFPGSTPAGARASILAMTLLLNVSMTATWSALSCATLEQMLQRSVHHRDPFQCGVGQSRDV